MHNSLTSGSHLLAGYPLDIREAKPMSMPTPLVNGYPPHNIHGHDRRSIPVPAGSDIRGYLALWIKLPSLNVYGLYMSYRPWFLKPHGGAAWFTSDLPCIYIAFAVSKRN
jgi:hypothetical protein